MASDNIIKYGGGENLSREFTPGDIEISWFSRYVDKDSKGGSVFGGRLGRVSISIVHMPEEIQRKITEFIIEAEKAISK